MHDPCNKTSLYVKQRWDKKDETNQDLSLLVLDGTMYLIMIHGDIRVVSIAQAYDLSAI